MRKRKLKCKVLDVEDVLRELRKLYRYINNSDYRCNIRAYFREVSKLSWSEFLGYCLLYPEVKEAYEKVKELNEIKKREKVYRYLEDMLEWMLSDEKNIYFGRYFEYNRAGISRRMIEEMAVEYEEIRDIWEEIKAIQESRLVYGMLHKKFDNKGAALVLKNVHGFKEKREVDVTEKHEVSIGEAIRMMKRIKEIDSEGSKRKMLMSSLSKGVDEDVIDVEEEVNV